MSPVPDDGPVDIEKNVENGVVPSIEEKQTSDSVITSIEQSSVAGNISPSNTELIDKQVTPLVSGVPETDSSNCVEPKGSSGSHVNNVESSITEPVPDDSESKPLPKTILETAQENIA